jgi:hypothetical protein
MGAREAISDAFLDAVNKLTPELDSIYEGAKTYSIVGWKAKQRTLVTASGGGAVAIPGFHVAAVIAETAFVINRTSVTSYGIGAIKGHSEVQENILEQEGFALIMGYWSDDESIKEAMKGKGAASVSSKVLVKAGTKLVGKGFAKGIAKAMLMSSGYLIGQKLGGKTMAKAAAKFSGKFAGKIGGGFLPVLGPIVGGGVNYWLISSISAAAEEYYNDKINMGLSL